MCFHLISAQKTQNWKLPISIRFPFWRATHPACPQKLSHYFWQETDVPVGTMSFSLEIVNGFQFSSLFMFAEGQKWRFIARQNFDVNFGNSYVHRGFNTFDQWTQFVPKTHRFSDAKREHRGVLHSLLQHIQAANNTVRTQNLCVHIHMKYTDSYQGSSQ